MENSPILFVSLGPGEAELITLKGFRALQEADYILCPATIASDGTITSRAADILQQLDIAAAKTDLFPLAMNKERSSAFQVYDAMYEKAVELHLRSCRVAIVAEGDAGFYSSIHYIYDRLCEAQIPAGFIAGVPAFIACGAVAGLHIVQQEERLTVLPGRATVEELHALVQAGTTVVVMKLSQCTHEIHRLMADHPEYQYHYFENVGTDREFYTSDTTLLNEKRYPYFSLLIIRHS